VGIGGRIFGRRRTETYAWSDLDIDDDQGILLSCLFKSVLHPLAAAFHVLHGRQVADGANVSICVQRWIWSEEFFHVIAGQICMVGWEHNCSLLFSLKQYACYNGIEWDMGHGIWDMERKGESSSSSSNTTERANNSGLQITVFLSHLRNGT
jgi:hypothetical protein